MDDLQQGAVTNDFIGPEEAGDFYDDDMQHFVSDRKDIIESNIILDTIFIFLFLVLFMTKPKRCYL